jgi:RNA polymerase sigma factor (sigma-70 family)
MKIDESERRFRALYDQARPRLFAYALRRTDSPEDAADVVAETFAIAWRRLDVVPDGHAGLLWLYATCRRVIANHDRRERRRVELTRQIGALLRTAVRDPLDEGAEAMLAATALGRLADDDREILMLVGWEGLSSAEVASLFGCSPTAARIRLHRARARLTAEMEQLGLVTRQQPPIQTFTATTTSAGRAAEGGMKR